MPINDVNSQNLWSIEQARLRKWIYRISLMIV